MHSKFVQRSIYLRGDGEVSPRWRCSVAVLAWQCLPRGRRAIFPHRPFGRTIFRSFDCLIQESFEQQRNVSAVIVFLVIVLVLVFVVVGFVSSSSSSLITRRRPSSSSHPLVLVISGLRRRIPRHFRPRRRLPTKTRNKHKHRKDRKKRYKMLRRDATLTQT